MADDRYKHGEMDIEEHKKTFDLFIKYSKRVAIAAVAVVVFLAIYAT
ncbi:MAG: aa3-type cytochrome c oxidase subunit IV [Pseudomonadota bacterium]